VLLARSGTLLLTWVDTLGRLHDLRRRLRDHFPHATRRQTTIIHTTLTRILTPRQMTAAQVQRISQECDEATLQVGRTGARAGLRCMHVPCTMYQACITFMYAYMML